MKFFSTFDTAASGMRAEQFRMDLISENIANAHTAKTADGTPYRRKMAIASAENKVSLTGRQCTYLPAFLRVCVRLPHH